MYVTFSYVPPQKRGGTSKMYHYIFDVPKNDEKKMYSLHFDGGESPKTVSYI